MNSDCASDLELDENKCYFSWVCTDINYVGQDKLLQELSQNIEEYIKLTYNKYKSEDILSIRKNILIYFKQINKLNHDRYFNDKCALIIFDIINILLKNTEIYENIKISHPGNFLQYCELIKGVKLKCILSLIKIYFSSCLNYIDFTTCYLCDQYDYILIKSSNFFRFGHPSFIDPFSPKFRLIFGKINDRVSEIKNRLFICELYIRKYDLLLDLVKFMRPIYVKIKDMIENSHTKFVISHDIIKTIKSYSPPENINMSCSHIPNIENFIRYFSLRANKIIPILKKIDMGINNIAMGKLDKYFGIFFDTKKKIKIINNMGKNTRFIYDNLCKFVDALKIIRTFFLFIKSELQKKNKLEEKYDFVISYFTNFNKTNKNIVYDLINMISDYVSPGIFSIINDDLVARNLLCNISDDRKNFLFNEFKNLQITLLIKFLNIVICDDNWDLSDKFINILMEKSKNYKNSYLTRDIIMKDAKKNNFDTDVIMTNFDSNSTKRFVTREEPEIGFDDINDRQILNFTNKITTKLFELSA